MTKSITIKKAPFEGKHHDEETKERIRQSVLLKKQSLVEQHKEFELWKVAQEAYAEELAAAEKAKEDAKYAEQFEEFEAQQKAEEEYILKEYEAHKRKEGVEIMTFIDACLNAESAAKQAFKETVEKKYGVDSETTQKLCKIFFKMSYGHIDITWRK